MVDATPRPLNPCKRHAVHILQKAGWTSGPVWRRSGKRNPPACDPRTVQPVVSRYLGTGERRFVFRNDWSVWCLYEEHDSYPEDGGTSFLRNFDRLDHLPGFLLSVLFNDALSKFLGI